MPGEVHEPEQGPGLLPVSVVNAKSKEQTISGLELDLPAECTEITGSRRGALRHVLQRPCTWL